MLTVTGNHKFIMYSPTMHATALNTAAMDTLQIPEGLPGVEIINGKATGVYLSDTSAIASSGSMHEHLSHKALFKALTDAAEDAAKNGCTSVQALMGIGNAPTPTDILLNNLDKMPINVYVWNQIWDVQKAKDMGLPRVGGCLNLDGASFEHTAAMFDGYTDAPHLRGELYHTDEEVYNFVSEAHRLGLACTMHAYSVNVENKKGSIELGKDADFTVIDRNPYDYVDSDELFNMKNLRTIVGGKTVYTAE